MSRPAPRPANASRSVIEAHRHHATAPFFGCPLCVRRTPFRGIPLRWSSPRLG